MSIKSKTLIGINLVAMIFLGIILISTNLVIDRSFTSLEETEIMETMDRLHDTVEMMGQDLEVITRDWAHWDDTWAFVNNHDPGFVRSNLTHSTYENYGLNLCVIWDEDNRILYHQLYDMNTLSLSDTDDDLNAFIRENIQSLGNLEPIASYTGMVRSPAGNLLFSILPILSSEGLGPRNGHLMMAKIIDVADIEALRGFKGTQIKATDLGDPTNLNLNQQADIVQTKLDHSISFKGRKSISAKDIIKGVDNSDLFLVELVAPMHAMVVGKDLRNLILMLYIILTLVQGIILSHMLRLNVIEKILSVEAQVNTIAQNPGTYSTVSYDGDDEIATLTENINKMLKALHKTQEELIVAKDKAEESNRLKTAFLSSMNHELRTPLNHIMGFNQLISMSCNTSDVQEYSKQIRGGGETLLKMIQDLFDLAIAEQSGLKANQSRVKCLDLFFENKANLEEILESSGKQAEIKLIFNPDRSAWQSSITVDATKVSQVLGNLFRNAVKFTSKGEIEYGFKLDKTGSIKYYVRDTGIGIPTDKREVLFEVFRQVDDSSTRSYGGVGIGLTIAQKLSEILHAKLYLESQEGSGSTFYLEIPCEVSHEPDSNLSEARVSSIGIPDLSKFNILLADGDMISKTIFRKDLQTAGARVVEAQTGIEALHHAMSSEKLDLAILDLNLAGADGVECSKQIRLRRADIGILALVSGLDEEESEALSRGKFDGYIEKPIIRDDAYRVICKTLHIGC